MTNLCTLEHMLHTWQFCTRALSMSGVTIRAWPLPVPHGGIAAKGYPGLCRLSAPWQARTPAWLRSRAIAASYIANAGASHMQQLYAPQ